MRNRFEQELESLKNSLLEMGGLIERAIELAVLALRNQDAAAARRAVAFDQEINEKERAIEHLCLKLLLQQQPVAADLRLISASLKMITDMERIGDQAADISEITLRLTGRPYIKKMVHIPQMAAASSKMVRQSIDAFVSGDLALAGEVVRMDDVLRGAGRSCPAHPRGRAKRRAGDGPLDGGQILRTHWRPRRKPR